MLIINDFYKRKKEAVSNQMEYLLMRTGGKIVSATRFMNQKPFRKEDRKDKIFIYPPVIYLFMLIINILFTKDDIHIFEEEPSAYKRFLCNLTNKKVYISMYREPFDSYIKHVKKYKNLSGIFVELDKHKKILLKAGVSKKLVYVSPTPAKIPRQQNKKIINLKHINLLFASWNNAEGNPLQERGLIYLLDLLSINNNFYLTILLRDNKIQKFNKEVEARKLQTRVKLIDIEEEKLIDEFDKCDFVVYPIQKKITKDVPNSLIDGISRGKPVIISTIFGLADIIKKTNSGIVILPNTYPQKIEIEKHNYNIMSKNAFELSKKYTQDNYVNVITNNYGRKI